VPSSQIVISPAPYFAGRDRSSEAAEVQGVVFDLDGQPADARRQRE
jgi:hypothetical protein